MRIALAQINPTVGDLSGNLKKILERIDRAKNEQVDLILFPELSLSGYPPEDFLLLPNFLNALEKPLDDIQKASKGIVAIVGTPRKSAGKTEKFVFNSAAIFSNGSLLGFQDKTLLPTYDVFSERRYFEPAAHNRVWELCGKRVAITICEDIWQHSTLIKYTTYLRDPILEIKEQQPDVLLNLSASPFSVSKTKNRLAACTTTALTLKCPVILCNQVGGNDSLIFDGQSLYVSREGQLLNSGKAFEEDFLVIDTNVQAKPRAFEEHPVHSLHDALVLGLGDYFQKLGLTRACLGLSGGIDSAVVACLAVKALGKDNVLGVSMPSRYSSKGSLDDAKQLAETLGIDYKVIPIETPFQTYLDLLGPHFSDCPADVTEENIQSRIRGNILMALSNKFGYIVLGTGNKSELAMGYATLYGDMCGGLGVINDVSKAQVYALAHWINREKEIIPLSTIQKPPSAELRPDQKDSDTLPDYQIIDNVLKGYVEEHRSPEEISKECGYPLELVESLVRRIHCNEYKRRQSPPGLRVTEKAFSVGRRFPIVQRWI
jgi:NAD+ synthase (glutamine-hydrolysing)